MKKTKKISIEVDALYDSVPGDGVSIAKEHPKSWWWCLHCNRAFQAKDFKSSGIMEKDACPWFASCNGAGIGIDIYQYDKMGEFTIPEADLKKGMLVQ